MFYKMSYGIFYATQFVQMQPGVGSIASRSYVIARGPQDKIISDTSCPGLIVCRSSLAL